VLNSERFSEIITRLKEGLDLRGRELFHPIRLALAGRAGEGELDRVILLLDEAAALIQPRRKNSTILVRTDFPPPQTASPAASSSNRITRSSSPSPARPASASRIG